jgi:glycosyltransferase involved in cell wall biosynthesis
VCEPSWACAASNRAGRRVTAFYRLEARLAQQAAAIIANSEAAARSVVSRGFPPERIHVVPNGVDVDRYRYNAAARAALRHEWGVTDRQVLIGRVGRLHPVKDYPTFLEAAALVAAERPETRFACVGGGTKDMTAGLSAQADRLGLAGRLLWAGHRDDMAAVMSALDVCVSSSTWESLPNVVGEAMACGVTCVVTDVGDSAALVGEEGFVIPARDPAAMAKAIGSAIDDLHDGGRREGARRRIVENFAPEALIVRTEAILRQLVPF